jgi:hypothetical protein
MGIRCFVSLCIEILLVQLRNHDQSAHGYVRRPSTQPLDPILGLSGLGHLRHRGASGFVSAVGSQLEHFLVQVSYSNPFQ